MEERDDHPNCATTYPIKTIRNIYEIAQQYETKYDNSHDFKWLIKAHQFARYAATLDPVTYEKFSEGIVAKRLQALLVLKEYQSIAKLLDEVSLLNVSSELMDQLWNRLQEDFAATQNEVISHLLQKYNYMVSVGTTVEKDEVVDVDRIFGVMRNFLAVERRFQILCDAVQSMNAKEDRFILLAYYTLKLLIIHIEEHNSIVKYMPTLLPSLMDSIHTDSPTFIAFYIDHFMRLQDYSMTQLVSEIVITEFCLDDYRFIPTEVILNAKILISYVRLFCGSSGGVTINDETSLQIIWSKQHVATVLTNKELDIIIEKRVFQIPSQLSCAVFHISSKRWK